MHFSGSAMDPVLHLLLPLLFLLAVRIDSRKVLLRAPLVLDRGGVAFLWPFTTDQFYFDPQIEFNLQGGINFNIDIEYGMRPFEQMGTTSFLSGEGAALLLLGVLVMVAFRKEA